MVKVSLPKNIISGEFVLRRGLCCMSLVDSLDSGKAVCYLIYRMHLWDADASPCLEKGQTRKGVLGSLGIQSGKKQMVMLNIQESKHAHKQALSKESKCAI